jgi:hypothetical protein
VLIVLEGDPPWLGAEGFQTGEQATPKMRMVIVPLSQA